MRRSVRLVLPLALLPLPAMFACESLPEVGGSARLGQDADANDTQKQKGGTDSIEIAMGGSAGSPATDDECDESVGSCEEEPPPPEPACGDGRINVSGETCDDMNGDSGDGCTANCELEANYVCPTPGEPCVSTVVCGDSKVTGDETCDDGNQTGKDGCDANCKTEPGYTCAFPGLKCTATECGDSIVAGNEECDFGSDVTGCTACAIDDGFDCDAASCDATVCGNGEVERGEQCEDGNTRPFDGCYDCAFEPACSGGTCTPVCGDGQRYDNEACDDGNTRDGDGCSATCKIETGFACTDILGTPPPTVELPVIYRDFIGSGLSLRDTDSCYRPRSGETPTAEKPVSCYHMNFNGLSGTSLQGVVETDLGPDGTPDLDCPAGDCSYNPGTNTNNFTTNEDFEDWYDDNNAESFPIFKTLTLNQGTGLTYSFKPSGGFYPIDNEGWVGTGEESAPVGTSCGTGSHNYSFSSETRFWFEYQGGERFDFNGDDDLWVFVNGKLAIDLAGLHGKRAGHFELDADTDDGGPDTADGIATVDNPLIAETTIDLGLTVGGIYEVALFHAERNFCGSNFELTLKNFNKPKSECESTCGDGIVASDELCDDGPSGNDGSYGSCGADCRSRGPHCGDKVRSAENGEECDDGTNLSTYGTGCAPGCKNPPSCGDGLVQSAFEDCDDGDNDGGYAECAAGCVLGPRCGDGTTDAEFGEQCDDGNRINGDGCNVNCVEDGILVR